VFNAKYEYKRGAEAALAANQIVPAAARAWVGGAERYYTRCVK
jgi:hypothetical protein